jgi:hypothetical protein
MDYSFLRPEAIRETLSTFYSNQVETAIRVVFYSVLCACSVVPCVSVVNVSESILTTETQRSPDSYRATFGRKQNVRGFAFVSLRVDSWIVAFTQTKVTIHEITRNITKCLFSLPKNLSGFHSGRVLCR